jgi:hypothetical protein
VGARDTADPPIPSRSQSTWDRQSVVSAAAMAGRAAPCHREGRRHGLQFMLRSWPGTGRPGSPRWRRPRLRHRRKLLPTSSMSTLADKGPADLLYHAHPLDPHMAEAREFLRELCCVRRQGR